MQNIINSVEINSRAAAAEGWTPSQVLGAIRLVTGQKAHKLIKSELIDKDKIRDGSENMKCWYEGYDEAMKKVLSLLYQTLVP